MGDYSLDDLADMLWEKLDHGNDLLTMEEDFPSILMYWASVIVTATDGLRILTVTMTDRLQVFETNFSTEVTTGSVRARRVTK